MSQCLWLKSKTQNKVSLGNFFSRAQLSMTILVIIFSLTGFLPAKVLAAGTTYYVDNTVTCSDTGPGSLTNPFCSISRGAAVARLPGDTVNVLHGTYAETVFLMTYSGTDGNPITFHAEPGVTVTGNSAGFGSAFAISGRSYIVVDGFSITQTKYKGIYLDSSNHITLSNNHVTYAGINQGPNNHQQGIYVRNTTYSTITNNVTDHNSCIGIWLANHSDYNTVSNNISFGNSSKIAYPTVVISDAAGIDLTGSSHNTVINNVAYANEDSGINLYIFNASVPSSYNLVIGNVVYGNGDHGIDNNNSPYNTLIGNTVQGNGTVGINFEGDSPATGSHHATAINNISVGNGFTPPTISFGGNLRVDSASVNGTILDYNLLDRQSAGVQVIWNNVSYATLAAFRAAVPTQEMHGVEGNPLFVSPAPSVLRTNGDDYLIPINVGDYHLTAGSPAIDSANADAPSQPVTDIEGKARVDDPATLNTGTGVRTYDDRGAYEFQPKIVVCYDLALGHTGQGSDPVASPTNSNGCPDGQYVAEANIDLGGAVPATGWQISSWTGTDNDNRITATNTGTMPASDHVVNVNYSQIEYSLTNSVVGNGSVTKIPDQATYHYGDSVQLTAVPDSGWNFNHWSGDLTGTSNPVSILIDSNKTVTAVFILANRAPTDITLSNASIKENELVGTLIGNFSTTDLDVNDTFTYSFCGGADDNSFQISGNNLQSAAIFDYEAKNSYSICVRSTDNGALSTTKTFTIGIINVDDTAPILVSDLRANPNPTNLASVQFLLTFSESVNGGAASNFVVTTTGTISGASITDVSSGPGTTRTVTVNTGSGDGTIRLDLVSTTGITDIEGNAVSNVPYTSGEVYLVDKTAPTVEINQAATQSDPTNLSPIYFTVVFSEAVTGFDGTDIALSGTAGATAATVAEVSPTNGTTYSVAVSGMTADGIVIAFVPEGAALDKAKNGNIASTSLDNIVTYNTGAPDTMIDSYPTNPSNIAEAIFAFSSKDDDATRFECQLDGGGFNTCESSLEYKSLGAGSHTFQVRAIDGAGNADPSPASYTWLIDLGYPIVSASTPTHGGTIEAGLTQLDVTFSEDIKHDGSADAADYEANYLLVEDGADNTFNTASCSKGLVADDTSLTINTATYTNNAGNGPFIVTLSIDPLPVGTYRLFVCGTTSIKDPAENKLNNGLNDTKIDFTIRSSGTASTKSNQHRNPNKTTPLLPVTGFPQGSVISLPAQPANKVYATTDLWLEIPKLGVNMSIVGVPQTLDGWDVSWLGKNAGWLNGSAYPTWNGNSVLTGHVWDALNNPGAFAKLKELKYGDIIKIHAFGQVYLYEIRESQTVSPSSTSKVFRHEEKSWLTLITCEDYQESSQTYSYRRMVRAVLVGVTADN